MHVHVHDDAVAVGVQLDAQPLLRDAGLKRGALEGEDVVQLLVDLPLGDDELDRDTALDSGNMETCLNQEHPRQLKATIPGIQVSSLTPWMSLMTTVLLHLQLPLGMRAGAD